MAGLAPSAERKGSLRDMAADGGKTRELWITLARSDGSPADLRAVVRASSLLATTWAAARSVRRNHVGSAFPVRIVAITGPNRASRQP